MYIIYRYMYMYTRMYIYMYMCYVYLMYSVVCTVHCNGVAWYRTDPTYPHAQVHSMTTHHHHEIQSRLLWAACLSDAL